MYMDDEEFAWIHRRGHDVADDGSHAGGDGGDGDGYIAGSAGGGCYGGAADEVGDDLETAAAVSLKSPLGGLPSRYA